MTGLSDDMARWIREYHGAGEPDEKIAAELGVTVDQVRETLSYGLNVTRWKADHPGWILAPGFECVGWRARPGHGPGGWVSAGTLDELAELVKARKDEQA